MNLISGRLSEEHCLWIAVSIYSAMEILQWSFLMSLNTISYKTGNTLIYTPNPNISQHFHIAKFVLTTSLPFSLPLLNKYL